MVAHSVLQLSPDNEMQRFHLMKFGFKSQAQMRWGFSIWGAILIERALLLSVLFPFQHS